MLALVLIAATAAADSRAALAAAEPWLKVEEGKPAVDDLLTAA